MAVPTARHTSQQFAAVVNNVRRMREAAPEDVVREGREWYHHAHEDALYHSSRAGHTGAAVGAGVLAALSSQNPWLLNRVQATQMHELSRDHVEALRAGDRSVLAGTPLNYRDTASILHAHAILTGAAHPRESLRNTGTRVARDDSGATILDPVTGKAMKERHAVKKYNFQSNIEDPEDPDPVTVDTHALKAAMGSGREKDKDEIAGLQHPDRYGSFADAYRVARQHAGDPTAGGTQAIVWTQQLRQFPNRQPDPGLKFLGTQWDPREHGLHLPSDLSIFGQR